MTERATRILSLQRDHVTETVAGISLRRYLVDSIDGDGYLVLEDLASGEVEDEPYVALDTPGGYAAGDEVYVAEVMGRGGLGSSTRIVVGKPGGGTSGRIEMADTDAVGGNNTTTNFATVKTLSVPLPAGMWSIVAVGSLLMSHSVNQAAWRIVIDGNAATEHALSMVTEERFEAAHDRSGIAGGRTVDVTLQARSVTAGTTTWRNPSLRVTAMRTG